MSEPTVRLVVVAPGDGVDLGVRGASGAVVAEVVPAVPAPAPAGDPAPPLEQRVAALRADRRHPYRLALEAVRRGRGDAVVCWGDPALLAAAAHFVAGPVRGATHPMLAAVPPDGSPGVLCDVSPGLDPAVGRGADALLTTASLAQAAGESLGTGGLPHLLVAGHPYAVPPVVGLVREAGQDLAVAPVSAWAHDRRAVPVAVCPGDVGAALADVAMPRSSRVVLGVGCVAVAGPADPGTAEVDRTLDLAAAFCRGGLLDRSSAALAAVVRARRRAARVASTGTDPGTGGRIGP